MIDNAKTSRIHQSAAVQVPPPAHEQVSLQKIAQIGTRVSMAVLGGLAAQMMVGCTDTPSSSPAGSSGGGCAGALNRTGDKAAYRACMGQPAPPPVQAPAPSRAPLAPQPQQRDPELLRESAPDGAKRGIVTPNAVCEQDVVTKEIRCEPTG
jgi:hypothetical protein